MPKLGPSSGGGTGGGSEGVPAGEYIIALKSFQRKVSQTSRNEYLRCRWVVCAGPLEGKSFFSNVSCNFSTEGTVSRWRIWMEACGVEEEFEVGSIREGTQSEGDQNIRDLFRNKPFKVTVKVEKNGNYVNNDIQMIHYVRSWTEEDKRQMDLWLDALEKAGQPSGSPQDDDGGDSAPHGGGGGGDFAGGGFAEDEDYGPPGAGTKAGGFAGDDDIPF